MSNEYGKKNCYCSKEDDNYSSDSEIFLGNIVANFSKEHYTDSNFRLHGGNRDDESLKSFESIDRNEYGFYDDGYSEASRKKIITFHSKTIVLKTGNSCSMLSGDVINIGRETVLRRSQLALDKNKILSTIFPQASFCSSL